MTSTTASTTRGIGRRQSQRESTRLEPPTWLEAKGTLSTATRTKSSLFPPALWATGSLEVVTGKLPLSLPSPWASDPAGLDHPRLYIAFSKAYKTPGESLQKCGAKWAILCFRNACYKITIQNAQREATKPNQANTDFTFFSICFFSCSPGRRRRSSPRCRNNNVHSHERNQDN